MQFLILLHGLSLPEQGCDRGGTTLTLVTQVLRRHLKTLFQWAVVAVTAIVLIRIAVQRGGDLGGVSLSFNFFWLPHAAIACSVANLLLPLGWRRLIIAFGATITTGHAVRLWSLAQAARYVPTGLLAVTSRLQLAAKAGISKTITASSIAIETAVLFAWALLTCALFVPSSTFPSVTRWTSGSAAVLGLATLPWLVPAASTGLSKLKKISVPGAKSRILCEGIALLGLSVFARALGTVCLATGYLELGSSDLPLIVGATYAAVIAGMIGITPAGLGVREGVITAILAGKFGLADAAAFALISRAWEFALEMLFLAAASWWGRSNRSSGDSKRDYRRPKGKL